MEKTIITWAFNPKENEWKHIDSVPNGIKCGCECLSCQTQLVARQGEVNEHSFAHQSDNIECDWSPESTIHCLAKQIIAKKKSVKVPPCDKIPQGGMLLFEEVRTEIREFRRDQQPDVIGIDKDGNKWCVEISNTNPLDAERKKKYREDKTYCIEIDVSDINAEQDKDASELSDFLLNSIENREWIYPVKELELNQSDRIEKSYPYHLDSLNEYGPFVNEAELKQDYSNPVQSTEHYEKLLEEAFRQNKHNHDYQYDTVVKKELTGKIDEGLLSQLNENQCEAVKYCSGPQLVIAGAGSGKTRVLTYKIAALLQLGLNPWNILALTFTNKAAREMKERIGRLVGMELSRSLNMGTFHSVFSRILRAEAETLGFGSNFTIYDQADSRSLVKSIIKEMQLEDKVYKASSVADRISMAKNHLLFPNQYARSSWAQDDINKKHPEISNIYIRYMGRCRQANAMDFDDLLIYTYVLFKNNEDIRIKYANRFQYVLVDEYQDTNFAQQAIVLLLTKEHGRVCVVGDDAQSIYSFRGANIDNILDFQKHYEGARLYKLEQNYRSTQLIVQAANSLIRKNERQIHKDVFSENEQGERLTLKPAYSDKEEAMIVCNDIKRIRRHEQCEYSDFAILYRTNAQSRSFEEQMRKDGIPYRIYGGLSFYQRKEIKDVIAYFRVVANPNDEEALRRIINYPARGIGDTTVGKIVETANLHNVSLWQVIAQPMVFDLKLSSGTLAKLEAFKTLVGGWMGRIADEDAYVLGHSIIMESGISKDIYSSNNPEDLSRQENLEEFLSGMQDFVESRKEEGREQEIGLSDFLQDVALLTDLDSEGDEDQAKVTLMTIHSAKGLEFPTVFVVGLEENIFPSPMCTNSMRELEEERRLLYVAITRAEKHCILTCAQNRFRYGKMEYDTPSRFIKDFDPSLIRIEGGSASTFGLSGSSSYSRQSSDSRFSRDFRTPQPSRFQNPRPVATQFVADPKPRLMPIRQEAPRPQSAIGNIGLKEGNVIEHQRFGIGTVIKIEGSGENTKATVEFRNAGTKQLLLKFAKYTIIS